MSDYIYGRNSFIEALHQGRIVKAYVLKDAPYNAKLKKAQIPFEIKDRRFLDKLARGGNHQGVVGETKPYPLSEVKDMLKENNGLLVLLDGIKDPQNLGAIMRTVDCVGADGVIYKKHNSVHLNSTVAKVSCGAIEYVKVAEVVNLTQTIKELKKKGYWVVAADAGGTYSYEKMDYNMNIALVIGAEGEGVSRLVKEECDFVVSLPMNGHLDSLNASVACGILLYKILENRTYQHR